MKLKLSSQLHTSSPLLFPLGSLVQVPILKPRSFSRNHGAVEKKSPKEECFSLLNRIHGTKGGGGRKPHQGVSTAPRLVAFRAEGSETSTCLPDPPPPNLILLPSQHTLYCQYCNLSSPPVGAFFHLSSLLLLIFSFIFLSFFLGSMSP